MDYQEAELPISDLDQADDTFRITTAPLDETLIRSIERVGVINRPLLIRKKDSFGIVCGFRRIAALEKTGEKVIKARLLPDNTPPYPCIEIAIHDNAAERPLNAIEMANAIGRIETICGPGEVEGVFERCLNLGRNKGLIQKLRAVNTLPEWMKPAILSGHLDFAVAAELTGYDHKDLSAMTDCFTILNLSLSKQREFVTLVTGISKRESVAVHELLDEQALRSILHDPDIEGNQKTAMVRSLLKQRRYPVLVQAETNYHQLQKALKLSPGTTLTPPKDFEGSTFTLTLNFNSIETLADRMKEIDSLMQHPVFHKLVTKAFY